MNQRPAWTTVHPMAERMGSVVEQVVFKCEEARFTGVFRAMTPAGPGEIQFLSGVQDTVRCGALEGDEALQELVEGGVANCDLVARLPQLGDRPGSFPLRGELGGRSAAELMRFCEENALTCRLEITVGAEVLVALYEMGELTSLEPDSERTAEMATAHQGTYLFILPQVELPQAARAPQARAPQARAPQARAPQQPPRAARGAFGAAPSAPQPGAQAPGHRAPAARPRPVGVGGMAQQPGYAAAARPAAARSGMADSQPRGGARGPAAYERPAPRPPMTPQPQAPQSGMGQHAMPPQPHRQQPGMGQHGMPPQPQRQQPSMGQPSMGQHGMPPQNTPQPSERAWQGHPAAASSPGMPRTPQPPMQAPPQPPRQPEFQQPMAQDMRGAAPMPPQHAVAAQGMHGSGPAPTPQQAPTHSQPPQPSWSPSHQAPAHGSAGASMPMGTQRTGPLGIRPTHWLLIAIAALVAAVAGLLVR